MSESDKISNLERRLKKLEGLVHQLLEQKAEPSQVPPKSDQKAGPPAAHKTHKAHQAQQAASGTPPYRIKQPPPPSAAAKAEQSTASFGERWLARGGVLMVFLALGFLFKYAADQGWVNPIVRVVFGMVLASAMLITGLKLHATRLRYSQILLGGSIAIYYLCGYASHQLYGLVEHTPAFFYMAGVTVVALILSVKQDHPSLACIGIAGGLSTPFFLPTPWGTIPALTLYTSTLLIGGGLIFIRRGWRTLAMTLWFGGLPVLFYCIDEIQRLDRDFIFLPLTAWWAIGGILPMVFNWKAQRWPTPSTQPPLSTAALRASSILSSGLAFVLASWNWRLEEREELWPLALTFAVGYAVLYTIQQATKKQKPVCVELAVGFAFLTIAIAFEYDTAFLGLLAAASLVLYLKRYKAFATSMMVSFALLVVMAVWFSADSIYYLSLRGEGEAQLHMLTRLLLLPTFVWASMAPKEENLRLLWRIFAYIGLLLWTFTELRYLGNGIALTTTAWAAQGGIALLAGIKARNSGLQSIALATLALVSGKMLLFDMANVDMIWRILLFFGVGAAFLGLSYLMNRPRQTA